MQRILSLTFLITLSLFLVQPSYAVIAATGFEVRSTGSDNNGGCFIIGGTGTDFSQQDAAQFSNTDLVLATTTTVSSVSHGFVSTDVGNCIQIRAGTGFTTGFYQIVSVAANIATLDRVAGTGGSTGGTWAEGGGLATPQKAHTALNSGTNSTSNMIWVKNATFTVTANLIASTFSHTMQGYTTSHGDTGRATITSATNSVYLLVYGTNATYGVQNINFTHTAATRAPGIGFTNSSYVVTGLFIYNSSFDGTLNAIEVAANTIGIQPLILYNVEIKNNTGTALTFGSTSTETQVAIWGCYIHANTGAAIKQTTAFAMSIWLQNSIIQGNGANGVDLVSASVLTSLNANRNNFVSTTGAGIKLSAAVGGQITNNVFQSNTTYGIDYSSGTQTTPAIIAYNAYRANSTAPTHNIFFAEIGAITLTADPFTSSSDFSLNSTAGGGTLLKGTGFPGALIAGGTGAESVGALAPAAGSNPPVAVPIL